MLDFGIKFFQLLSKEVKDARCGFVFRGGSNNECGESIQLFNKVGFLTYSGKGGSIYRCGNMFREGSNNQIVENIQLFNKGRNIYRCGNVYRDGSSHQSGESMHVFD